MAWRDDLRPGSYRGVEFYVESVEQSGGRRVVLDEYPLRDDPSTQDLGRKARQYNLEMFVLGEDYMRLRDQLIEALEQGGAGTLMHPYRGELQVVPYGEYRVAESTREGGMARISQSFVEAGESPRPDSQIAPGAEVNVAADQMLEEAALEFEDEWSVTGYAGFVADEAVSLMGDVTQSIGEAGGLLSGAGEFSSLLGRLQGGFQQLILSPGNLAGSLIGLVRGLTATRDPFAAFRAQLSLFDLGGQAKPVRGAGYVTPSRAQQVANQAAVYRLVERTAVSEAARLATGRPLDAKGQPLPGLAYDNRDQAVEVRDQVLAELDRQQLEAAPERYRALARLSSVLVADMGRRTISLAPLAQFQPSATQPALLIAHRLYGDARRADEIVARNRIAHPGFVPGGTVLEVLKDA